MEWISVKERLPEDGGRYLIYEKKEPHIHNCAAYAYPYPCCEPNIAYYNKYQDGWVYSSNSHTPLIPTHWMNLPMVPE